MKPTWQERLFARGVEDENGCWIWQGRSLDRDGYPMFHGPKGVNGWHFKRAAAWAYYSVHGPVPAGLEVDHLCNVRACINPAHLEAVTHQENLRRRSERQTHCIRGHERTPENTYRPVNGWSQCRACQRQRNAAKRAAAREQVPA